MALVKRLRVLWNVTILGLLNAMCLWVIRGHLDDQPEALVMGMGLGGLAGWWRWCHLRRRITRRDRRYERNRIFVDYLHLAEVVITALAYNPIITLPVAVGITLVLWWTPVPLAWWLVWAGSAAGAGLSVVFTAVLSYERQHGPLYYQYDSSNWAGTEGLLYQCGTVLDPLQPTGKVTLPGGVLWNAISLSGETIARGEAVEVISVQGLTLYVDRLPATSAANHTSAYCRTRL